MSGETYNKASAINVEDEKWNAHKFSKYQAKQKQLSNKLHMKLENKHN